MTCVSCRPPVRFTVPPPWMPHVSMPAEGVAGVACPQEPFPAGWSVWKGPVPPALTQWAMSIRDHINAYPYGQIVGTTEYAGAQVAAFKSHHHHTWTYRNGQLLQGICIPGVSLLVPAGSSAAAAADAGPSADLASFDAQEPIHWGEVAAAVLLGALLDHLLEHLPRSSRRRGA